VELLEDDCATLVYESADDWYVDDHLNPVREEVARCARDGLGIVANLDLYSHEVHFSCTLSLFPYAPHGGDGIIRYGVGLQYGSHLHQQLFPSAEQLSAESKPKAALLHSALAFGSASQAQGLAVDFTEHDSLSRISIDELRTMTLSQPRTIMDLGPEDAPDFPYIVALHEEAASRNAIIAAGWSERRVRRGEFGYIVVELL
jgi:hypothetical protein